MKSITPAEQTDLSNNVRYAADLYTFYFNPASPIYWTSADTNLTSGSMTWLTGQATITRGNAHNVSGLEVGTMTITISGDNINLKGMALAGTIDNARVTISRAYMNVWGVVDQAIVVFDGNVVEVAPQSTVMKLNVKSKNYLMTRVVASRLLQPSCPYQLFDKNCGLNPASFSANAAPGYGSTTTLLSFAYGVGFVAATGFLVFTAGALKNRVYTITNATTNSVQVNPALPYVPTSADTFTVYRGCDKTRNSCRNIFNNIARFGGFPDTPLPNSWSV